MTGIAPYNSGIYNNRQAWRPAMREAVTLPQAFMRAGYWVGGSGKIYHGVYPDPPSWHEYSPSKMQQRSPDPRPGTPAGKRNPGVRQLRLGPA